jgi:hypothetical protein
MRKLTTCNLDLMLLELSNNCSTMTEMGNIYKIFIVKVEGGEHLEEH